MKQGIEAPECFIILFRDKKKDFKSSLDLYLHPLITDFEFLDFPNYKKYTSCCCVFSLEGMEGMEWWLWWW